MMITSFTNNISIRILTGIVFWLGFAWLFFHFSKGTGKILYGLLSFGFGVSFYFLPILQIISLLLLIIILVTFASFRARVQNPYEIAKASFEGGGIKRGLTPPEAAVLLKKPVNVILASTIVGLLEKSFIVLDRISPVKLAVSSKMRTRNLSMNSVQRATQRRHLAQELGQVLFPFEELFLELLEQEEDKELSDIDFGILLRPFIESVAGRLGGYDLELSREYYVQLIDKAPKESRLKNDLITDKLNVFERNYRWILLVDDFDTILNFGEQQFQPAWYISRRKTRVGSFSSWVKSLMKTFKETISEEYFQTNLGKEPNNLTSILLHDIAH